MAHQHRLHLAGLDAVAAHLDLAVDPARELQGPSGRKRARSPVRYSRAPGIGRERMGDEALGRAVRLVEVPPGEESPPRQTSPATPGGTGSPWASSSQTPAPGSGRPMGTSGRACIPGVFRSTPVTWMVASVGP